MVPGWVKDGGYFQNPETDQLIGIANDSLVPAYITQLTKEELTIKVLALHEINPFKTEEDVALTEQEVTDMVLNWCSQRGE